MAIALVSGPQDPSQLDNLINSLIGSLNGYLTGSTPLTVPVVNGTTGANLPNSGVVTISTATGNMVLSRPIPGQEVDIITQSTKSMTVTILGGGTFNKTHTKLTFKTTNAAGGANVQQAVSLVGLTTSIYGIKAVIGTVKST
jgi:hypothetical protein